MERKTGGGRDYWHESTRMDVPSGETKVSPVLINAWNALAFSAFDAFFCVGLMPVIVWMAQ
jgi:hypothetical protein